MARRKIGNSHTTISITWEDKEKFRQFAQFVKKTKTGDLYESDAVLFHNILLFFSKQHQSSEIKPTYPSRVISPEPTQLC